MYLRQSLGSVFVFALQDKESEIEKFETLCHNYSICDNPQKLYPRFSFVITTLSKVYNGFYNYYYNNYYKYTLNGLREKAAKHLAFKVIQDAKEDTFYTQYLNEINKNKEYIESIIGIDRQISIRDPLDNNVFQFSAKLDISLKKDQDESP